MRVRIEGIVYNTDTARAVGSRDNGRKFDQDAYFIETLYQKKNRGFFLWIDGIAAVKRIERPGWIYADGEDIFPFSDDQALVWMNKYGQRGKLLRYFPEEYEGGDHE